MVTFNANDPAGPRMVEALHNELRCLELREAGYSYRKMSDKLKHEGVTLSPKGCWLAVDRALKKMRDDVRETATDVVPLELDRLDRMLKGLLPTAEAGDVKSVHAVIAVMDRRAKYLGLNVEKWPEGASGAPEAPAVNVSALTDGELEAAKELLAKLANG